MWQFNVPTILIFIYTGIKYFPNNLTIYNVFWKEFIISTIFARLTHFAIRSGNIGCALLCHLSLSCRPSHFHAGTSFRKSFTAASRSAITCSSSVLYRASRPRSFIFQLPEELSPGSIRNTFCQMVVSQHPLHIEVFHTDDLVLIHQCG